MSQEINFTINGSLIEDYDIFAETEPSSFSIAMRWIYGIAELLKFGCGVLALASDIYLIVIISKFEALKTRINNFILQYAIYNLMFLLLANLIYLTIDLIGFRVYYWSTYMFIGLVDDLTLYLSSFVLTLMTFDWFISNYYPNIYDQYKKLFKHGSYIVLLVATFLWIIVSILCIVEHESLDLVRLVLEELSFIFCVTVIIIVAVLSKQKNRSCIEAYKTEYALTIPKTVFMLLSCYYTSKIYLALLNGDMVPRYLYQISYLFLYIGEILLLASPVVVVCQLIKINKHFRSAYIKSCNKKRVHNYDDDNLDADSLTDTPVGNVTFDKDAVAISF